MNITDMKNPQNPADVDFSKNGPGAGKTHPARPVRARSFQKVKTRPVGRANAPGHNTGTKRGK
jgi:hypothetical protein